jgi:diacylglycerol kinase (CTP)
MEKTSLDMEDINQRPQRSELHLVRKFWHMGTGSLALYLYYISTDKALWPYIALVIAVIGFVFDFLRMKSRRVNKFAFKVGGPFYRESERDGISGLPYYALGIALSLFFYKESIAILSIWFLVFSDPLSSLFGVLFGQDKILPNKSLQGSMAGFCTCYLITIFYCLNYTSSHQNILGFSILAGIFGAVSELLSAFNIDDNLTIPVVSGLGLTLINYFFQIL